MLRAAVASAFVAIVSLVWPVVERIQVEDVATERSRRLMTGAAWQWQGLVAAGMPPGEATEKVSEALHARIVSAGTERVDIPFMPESDVEALHNSFRLNPFIRGTIPRTNDAVEQRELRESATRVAVLTTAVRKRELEHAHGVAQRHLAWGLLVSLTAGVASVLLFVRWKRRDSQPAPLQV
jgi:hypothetical protein